MIEVFKFEGKSEDEIIQKAMSQLGIEKENIYISIKETEAKLFKAKKIMIEIIKKDSVVAFVKEFINSVAELMNIEVKSEVKEMDGIINVVLVSDNNPILIGKEGRTLNSLQLLIRQALSAQTGLNIKVNIDASNYKGKKLKNLEYDIKRIIREVLNTHGEVKLDPMNSYERRFVHNLIGDFKELSSNSEGEGQERHIVIKYIENK